MKEIVVVGSVNEDHVFNTNDFVKCGETIKSKRYQTFLGGKGANQAVAIKRADKMVTFIGCIGNDEPGIKFINFFAEEGIATYLQRGEVTGKVFIEVTDSGANRIITAPLANLRLEINRTIIEILDKADYIVLQNEINVEVNKFIFANYRAKIIYNPSPIADCIDEIKGINTLIVNEHECSSLLNRKITSRSDLFDNINDLCALEIDYLVVTFGAKGAACVYNNKIYEVIAPEVKVVDTTAAGDTFLGYFVAGYDEDIERRLSLATHYASRAVEKQGAIPSIPRKDD